MSEPEVTYEDYAYDGEFDPATADVARPIPEDEECARCGAAFADHTAETVAKNLGVCRRFVSDEQVDDLVDRIVRLRAALKDSHGSD